MEPVVAASALRPAPALLSGRHSPSPSLGAWLLVALVLGLALAVQFGAVPVGSSDWWAPLASLGGNAAAETRTGSAYVLWDVRLPRAVLAVLVGASLGLAGALAQGLFRNPMAEPGLLGVTAGAACAAALVLTVFASLHMAEPPAWRVWVLPAIAFAGALLLAADTVARTVAIPAEIPVGIFIALMGAPAFLAMLRGAAHSRGSAV